MSLSGLEPENEALVATLRGGTCGGINLAFTNPLYYIDHSKYHHNGSYLFRFCAFVHTLQRARPRIFAIDALPAGDASSLPGDPRWHPAPDGPANEFQFQAPVTGVTALEFLGEPLLRLSLALSSPGAPPFPLDAFVAPSRIEPGFDPEPGDDLAGSLWLQGYLAD